MSTGDHDSEQGINMAGNNVVALTHADAMRIFNELSSINSKFSDINSKFNDIENKLDKLIKIEIQVSNLNENQIDLKKRIEEIEKRERDNSEKLNFANTQAKEFSDIKPQITVNSTKTGTFQLVINWLGGIASIIVAAAIINGSNIKDKAITREEHKSVLKIKDNKKDGD